LASVALAGSGIESSIAASSVVIEERALHVKKC